MKTTLGKQMLLIFFVPLFVIFLLLNGLVHSTVSRYVNNWVQLELRGLIEINATDLAGQIENVRSAVSMMAIIIEDLDETAVYARERVSGLVNALFTYDAVFNAWAVFEPQAFDGRDSEFTQAYPGAPSGRFMLSYVKDDDGDIIIAPDMDEEWIDDPVYAYWYVIPRDEARLYIDTDTSVQNVYDYGTEGENPVYTLSVAAPVFRNGEVIGVVGADIAVDTMTISISSGYSASHISTVAVFYSSGLVFYSPDIELAEERITTLGFANEGLILEAFEDKRQLFLPDELCVFAETDSMIYFQPVNIIDYDDVLFLYVSLPRSVYYANLLPIIVITVVTSAAVLVVLLFLLRYVIYKVSRPINKLTMAAEAISQGNIEIAIDYSPDAQTEIGLLSQSLHTMVEKFRVNTQRMEQAQREAEIKARIEAFITAPGNMREVFEGICAILSEYFSIRKTTIVYKNAGGATAFSDGETPYEYPNSEQTEALLADRRLVFMNTQAIRSHNLDFLNPDTISACITPLRSDAVMGYIIFENTDIKTFSEGTESIIIFISEIMGEWLSGKDWDAADNERDAAADGNGATQTQTDDGPSVFDDDMPVMQRFRKIKGLAVDYALERMGGLEEAYEKTVRILARLMPEATEKMDRHIASKNLKDFTVEVHGIKGVLRNIGAVDLGNDAAALEGAAIEKRMEFCAERYVPFKEALMRFSERLDAALAEKPDTVKDKIDKETLLAAVIAAKEAANGFDAMGAADTLAEAAKLSYNDETDVLLKDVLLALEVFDCKGALINIIKMEEILNG